MNKSELARIDTQTLLGLIGGFPEKRDAAVEEVLRRIESLKDCAKAFADRGAEIAELRAENKRKDEHIANLEREAQYALDFLENWELSDFPSAAHDESTQGSLYMTIAGLQEVLLQSEKGGE